MHNIPTLIEALLAKSGLVEFVFGPIRQGQRFEAVARFNTEAGARKAERTLHDTRQDFLNGGSLAVRLVESTRFKLPTTVYDALETQLTTRGVKWKARGLWYEVYRNTDLARLPTTLTIEGTEFVTKAANEFEKTLTGEAIMDGDQPLLSMAFAGNRGTCHLLKWFQKTHSVAIIRDRKMLLKFFGPPEKHPQVQRDIMEHIKSESSTTHAIRLDSRELTWIRKGRFEQISSTLGNNVASLDMDSEPRDVIITGSAKQHQTALAIIQGKPDSNRRREVTARPTKGQDCVVCWAEAERPILTKCSHTYCFEYFENLCLSTGSGNKSFTICCQGEMGKCTQIFSLCELQDHLPSVSFEHALGAYFSSYISRNPQRFRYCPTPDCGYIYRSTSADTPSAHICSNCRQAVCTACDGQHNGMLNVPSTSITNLMATRCLRDTNCVCAKGIIAPVLTVDDCVLCE